MLGGVGHAGWNCYSNEYNPPGVAVFGCTDYVDMGRWDWEQFVGGGLVIQIGYSVVDDLAVYLDLASNFPQVFGVGAGIGWYYYPGFYVDAAFGYSLLAGLYGALTLGVEWWVSDQWGIGIAFRQTTGMTDASVEDSMFVANSLMFSATYN
jgi:hypothetical protein